MAKTLTDEMREKIKGFSDRQRLILNLHFCEDMSATEIANLLDVPVDRITYTLSKMINKLNH